MSWDCSGDVYPPGTLPVRASPVGIHAAAKDPNRSPSTPPPTSPESAPATFCWPPGLYSGVFARVCAYGTVTGENAAFMRCMPPDTTDLEVSRMLSINPGSEPALGLAAFADHNAPHQDWAASG